MNNPNTTSPAAASFDFSEAMRQDSALRDELNRVKTLKAANLQRLSKHLAERTELHRQLFEGLPPVHEPYDGRDHHIGSRDHLDYVEIVDGVLHADFSYGFRSEVNHYQVEFPVRYLGIEGVRVMEQEAADARDKQARVQADEAAQAREDEIRTLAHLLEKYPEGVPTAAARTGESS